MKKLFALLLGMLLLVSCNQSSDETTIKDPKMQLEEAIKNVDTLTSFEAELIASDADKINVFKHINIKINSAKRQMIVSNDGELTYIFGDYLCDSYGNVSNRIWTDTLRNQLSFINHETLSIENAIVTKFPKSKNNFFLYEVEFSKIETEKFLADLNDLIDLTLSLSNLEFIFSVNKYTNYLENVTVTADISQEEQSIGFEFNFTIKPLNDNNDLLSQEMKYTLSTKEALKAYVDEYTIENINLKTKEPTFEPKSNYEDNQIITYSDRLSYDELFYDETTNTIILWLKDSIKIYDAKTLVELQSMEYPSLTDVDTIDGYLALCSATRNVVSVYDIKTLTKSFEFTPILTHKITHIALADNKVFYTGDDQWCKVYMADLKLHTQDIIVLENIYKPDFLVNRENNILYVYETGISRTDVKAINIFTCKLSFSFSYGDYFKSIYFDGTHLHLNGDTLIYSGNILSKNNLSQNYTPLSDFTPSATIFNKDTISIVRGYSKSYYQVAVYDNTKQKYIAIADFDVKNVFPLKDQKYLLTDREGMYYAIIDISKCNPLPNHINTTYNDANIFKFAESQKIIFPNNYDKILSSDTYLFLLCSEAKSVVVYERATLKHIKTLTYLSIPVDIDYDNNRLAVVLGPTSHIFVYNTNNWETLDFYVQGKISEKASSVIISGDIVYCLTERKEILKYNYKTKELIDMNHFIMSNMAIDRNTQTFYFFDMYTLCNLQGSLHQEIVELEYKSTTATPIITGDYLLAGGYIFELPSMNLLTSSLRPLLFDNNEEGEILYYDGKLCVYVQTVGTAKYTIIYDTINKKIINRLGGIYNVVLLQGNNLYVGIHGSNFLIQYDLTNQ